MSVRLLGWMGEQDCLEHSGQSEPKLTAGDDRLAGEDAGNCGLFQLPAPSPLPPNGE